VIKLRRKSAETVQARYERELRAENDRGARIEAAANRDDRGPAPVLKVDVPRTASVRRLRPVFIWAALSVSLFAVRTLLSEQHTEQQTPQVTQAAPLQATYHPDVSQAYQRPGGGRDPGALIDMPARAAVFIVSAFGGPGRQLTPSWGTGASPAWRPDGRALALVWNAQLVEVGVAADGRLIGQPIWKKKSKALTRPTRLFSPTYSPDGSQLAFVSARSIWVVRRGSQPRQVTHDWPNYYFVDWSPKGDTLLAMRNGLTTIFSLRSKASRTVPTGRAGWDPRWGPDGQTIAVTLLDGQAMPHVFLTDSSASYFNDLFPGHQMTQYASWSRDGHQLVYAKFVEAEDQWDLFVYDWPTKSEHQVTHTPINETTPVFSPNGELIAYARTSA
jgi:hypothetical protein